MKIHKYSKFLFLLIGLNLIGCSSIEGRPISAPPIKSVENLDLNKYLGKWFEIARYPNSFEKNCINVTAEYSLRSDGKINVLNSCVDARNESKIKKAKAIAVKIENKTSVFAVNFAPIPLPKGEGNYHVLWVDDNYTKAIVGEPKGKYLWFLSRKKNISAQDFDEMKNIAANQFYDLKFLEIVEQR